MDEISTLNEYSSLTGGLKTCTGMNGDPGIRRNDIVAVVMPAEAGTSTNK